jgi:alpha-D-ribose 1-methylphosphonate 5-triphosphate synthase subunit PhnG
LSSNIDNSDLAIILANISENAAVKTSPDEIEMRERRRRAMAVLTCSSADEIARHLAALDPLPAHTQLREPQSGLVMLRGRIGGDGAPFNFGEATVSRCAVRLAAGETGFGYALGRDHEKARLIALVDAMIQLEQWQSGLEKSVLAPIEDRLTAEREKTAQQVAATKVEFFTLVRGEG